MVQLKYFTVLSVHVASGASGSVNFIPREDLLIRRVFATERANENLSNVFADIDFMGVDLTYGDIPVVILGNDVETAYTLEKVLKAGNAITFNITNKLGVAIDLDITLECHPPA